MLIAMLLYHHFPLETSFEQESAALLGFFAKINQNIEIPFALRNQVCYTQRTTVIQLSQSRL